MPDPKVSILILTYNRLELSKKCIPMILNNIGNIDNEVLIWDNGSTDGTYDWLEEYGRADCRITEVIGYHKNIGMEAINRLANMAKGQYILKIDSDVFPPPNFAERLVNAYEEVNEEKLIFLGWDMEWGLKTFATRSGMHLYKGSEGKIVTLKSKERVLIHFTPSKFMVHGALRLSRKAAFLDIGGHPKGLIYGADHPTSIRAAKKGYWIGFLSSTDLLLHLGGEDSEAVRKMKDAELVKHGAPKDV